MKIKNIAVKFFAAAMFVSYVGSASAAFTGGVTVVVDGSTTVTGGLNSGVDFAAVSETVIITDIDDQGTPRLASSSGAVDFGVTDFFGNPSDFALSFFSPFVDFDIADPAGTLLLSSIQLSGDIVELSLTELVDIEPVSGDSTNGAVDYAGLGNLTINGLEQTEVFWQYNVTGGSVGINIDAAGQQSAVYIGIINAQASAIPVPAAVWLFGSALVGLFGLSRKKVS